MTTGAQKQNVPRLRFPEFNGEWISEPLGCLCKVFDGTHQTPTYKKEGVPFYSVESVTNDNFTDVKFISKNIYDKESIKLEIGDILMTRIGDIGTSKLIDWDVCASFYVSLALIKKSNKINNAYLDKYISSVGFQRELWRRTIHVAFPKKINLGEIGNCIVSFPDDCIEQQKIATFLTAVDNKISLLTRKVDNLEKYKKGLMNQIFSQKVRFKDDNGETFPDWEVKKLGDVAKIKTGNLNVQDSNDSGKYVFFDRSDEIKKCDEFSFDVEALIYPGEGSDFLPKYYEGKFGLHQRSYIIFDIADLYLKFLFYFMLTQNNHFKKFAVGSTVKSLRIDCFEKCKVPIPTLPEQQKIATLLTSLDDKITHTRNQLDKTKEFKKALMQRMFV